MEIFVLVFGRSKYKRKSRAIICIYKNNHSRITNVFVYSWRIYLSISFSILSFLLSKQSKNKGICHQLKIITLYKAKNLINSDTRIQIFWVIKNIFSPIYTLHIRTRYTHQFYILSREKEITTLRIYQFWIFHHTEILSCFEVLKFTECKKSSRYSNYKSPKFKDC